MNNISLENPLEILEKKEILAALKKHWIGNHENLTNPEKFAEEFFMWLSQTFDVHYGHQMSIAEIKKYYKKKLKEYWDESLHLKKPKDMFLEMIEDELDGVSAILDFGCGKLAFLKEIAENNKTIKKLIGVDSKSNPILEELDARIEFQKSLAGVKKETVDLAIVKLVLHHLKNDAEILEIFQNIKKVLRSSGKLIIFEESFPEEQKSAEASSVPNGYLMSAGKYLAKYAMEPSESTEDFLQLPEEDKIKFLFLNDWLMNVQNNYMPWTGRYKSMEEWSELIESAGFRKQAAHFLGAIKHRKRKQGMTAILKFGKIA